MRTNIGLTLTSVILLACFSRFVYCRPSAEAEFAIRKKLLTNYDKTVRPSTGPDFIVLFSAKISQIVKVDDVDQTITVSSWVVMQWNNSFLEWNTTDYGGMDRVHFRPTEIWFPDVALYNNGDPNVAFAGGPTKFTSNVIVSHTGKCTWSGPSPFTAECTIDIKKWPFDDQTCSFDFSSFSYDKSQLQLKIFNLPKTDPEGNENWEVDSQTIEVGESNRGDCCPYSFANIKYTLKIRRLFQYQLFYIFAPCCILTILSLLSFLIPSESGERIGFVTTLLLSLMVYLLVVPESLPVSSKEIPILGVVIMSTLVIISLVLLATIIVLVVFHRTKPPSWWNRCLLPLASKPLTPVMAIEMEQQKSHATLRAVHPNLTPVETAPATPEKQEMQSQPDYTPLWQDVSYKLDKILFFVFLMSSLIIFLVVIFVDS